MPLLKSYFEPIFSCIVKFSSRKIFANNVCHIFYKKAGKNSFMFSYQLSTEREKYNALTLTEINVEMKNLFFKFLSILPTQISAAIMTWVGTPSRSYISREREREKDNKKKLNYAIHLFIFLSLQLIRKLARCQLSP
jgi:hypothetical protein